MEERVGVYRGGSRRQEQPPESPAVAEAKPTAVGGARAGLAKNLWL